jgi:hypothetical protein
MKAPANGATIAPPYNPHDVKHARRRDDRNSSRTRKALQAKHASAGWPPPATWVTPVLTM